MNRHFPHNTRFAGEERVPFRKHEEQTLQEWFALFLNSQGVLFCASTQGMKLGKATACRLKRMGYKKGYPDVAILEPRGKWHGMFVELKVGDYPSDEQKKWQDDLLARGYYAIIVPGRFEFEEAREFLEKETKLYLNQKGGEE